MTSLSKKCLPLSAALLFAPSLAACANGGMFDGGSSYRDDGYVLSDEDRIYRGQDGRYYCHRKDGTQGLIIGGLTGAVVGNIIAPGGSKTLGTLLGGGAGALAGREIDRRNVRCR